MNKIRKFEASQETSILSDPQGNRSKALGRLFKSQTRINRFFWSSELAYQVCVQRLLRPMDDIARTQLVTDVFSNVEASALLTPNNKKREAHYRKSVVNFEKQLRLNLESVSEHVILDFFGEFELYLEERLTKLLMEKSENMKHLLDEIKKKGVRSFHREWGDRKEKGLVEAFKNMTLTELLRTLKALEILHQAFEMDNEILIKAEGYRFLRHKLTHPESHTFGDEERFEASLRDRILSDRRFIKLGNLDADENNCDNNKDIKSSENGSADLNPMQIAIICSVFDEPMARKQKGRADNPLIFYQAIFALGAFNNFAVALDAALPFPRGSIQAPSNMK